MYFEGWKDARISACLLGAHAQRETREPCQIGLGRDILYVVLGIQYSVLSIEKQISTLIWMKQFTVHDSQTRLHAPGTGKQGSSNTSNVPGVSGNEVGVPAIFNWLLDSGMKRLDAWVAWHI